ncbi:MAG: orotidine-5'-phosphate decarboxylase [Nitrospirae bacterium]|nr:orotidine-5'-phosphate decarboxylase [Nitrospirota bacterium]
MKISDKIILALDVADSDSAVEIVEKFKDHIEIFKIGSELFTSAGPDVVKKIISMGKKVFLDLKFHDIPNTAAKSVKAAAEMGVFMLNVHASGGAEMMRKASHAVSELSSKKNIERPKLLAVTVLTSIDEAALQKDAGVGRSIEEQVMHLAKLAMNSGLDGVVASPRETEMIRSQFGRDFLIVTPGIRPSWANADDQKRTMTPAEAIKKGSDYIVIGRAVLSQPDPIGALKRIIENES